MSSLSRMRRQEIANFVNERSFCDVNSIINHFNVSPATIRRDLKSLEEEGFLYRTRGIVKSVDASSIPNFLLRQTFVPEEKRRMAENAAHMVK